MPTAAATRARYITSIDLIVIMQLYTYTHKKNYAVLLAEFINALCN